MNMNDIVDILIRRDKISRSEAKQLVDETQEMIDERMEEEDCTLSDIEDIISDQLGLEPDYLDYFII